MAKFGCSVGPRLAELDADLGRVDLDDEVGALVGEGLELGEKSVACGVCFSVPTTVTPCSIGIWPPVALLGLARQALRNSTSGSAKAASSCRMPNFEKPSLVRRVVTVTHMSAARLVEFTGPMRKMYLPGPVESTPLTTSGAAAPADT
jgi:hypothetical protein